MDCLFKKVAGVWTSVENLHYKDGGAWLDVDSAYVKMAGAWQLACDVVADNEADIHYDMGYFGMHRDDITGRTYLIDKGLFPPYSGEIRSGNFVAFNKGSKQNQYVDMPVYDDTNSFVTYQKPDGIFETICSDVNAELGTIDHMIDNGSFSKPSVAGFLNGSGSFAVVNNRLKIESGAANTSSLQVDYGRGSLIGKRICEIFDIEVGSGDYSVKFSGSNIIPINGTGRVRVFHDTISADYRDLMILQENAIHATWYVDNLKALEVVVPGGTHKMDTEFGCYFTTSVPVTQDDRDYLRAFPESLIFQHDLQVDDPNLSFKYTDIKNFVPANEGLPGAETLYDYITGQTYKIENYSDDCRAYAKNMTFGLQNVIYSRDDKGRILGLLPKNRFEFTHGERFVTTGWKPNISEYTIYMVIGCEFHVLKHGLTEDTLKINNVLRTHNPVMPSSSSDFMFDADHLTSAGFFQIYFHETNDQRDTDTFMQLEPLLKGVCAEQLFGTLIDNVCTIVSTDGVWNGHVFGSGSTTLPTKTENGKLYYYEMKWNDAGDLILRLGANGDQMEPLCPEALFSYSGFTLLLEWDILNLYYKATYKRLAIEANKDFVDGAEMCLAVKFIPDVLIDYDFDILEVEV